MKRATKKSLEMQTAWLNTMLERPEDMFASELGEKVRMNIGHVYLDHNNTGYQLEEIVSESGATRNMTDRLTAKEMYITIRSIIKGIGLRNHHIGELLLRNELSKQGLCKPDHRLYNQDTTGAVAPTI